jgi:hypothetical protein
LVLLGLAWSCLVLLGLACLACPCCDDRKMALAREPSLSDRFAHYKSRTRQQIKDNKRFLPLSNSAPAGKF